MTETTLVVEDVELKCLPWVSSDLFFGTVTLGQVPHTTTSRFPHLEMAYVPQFVLISKALPDFWRKPSYHPSIRSNFKSLKRFSSQASFLTRVPYFLNIVISSSWLHSYQHAHHLSFFLSICLHHWRVKSTKARILLILFIAESITPRIRVLKESPNEWMI